MVQSARTAAAPAGKLSARASFAVVGASSVRYWSLRSNASIHASAAPNTKGYSQAANPHLPCFPGWNDFRDNEGNEWPMSMHAHLRQGWKRRNVFGVGKLE